MDEDLLESILQSPAPIAAPQLIGMVLTSTLGGQKVAGRIIEVEAYTQQDPASHSFNGRTLRNQSMFSRPGTAYVYFTYGMHHCLNISVNREDVGEAVLIRALEPVDGLSEMWHRRYAEAFTETLAATKLKQLVNGPAKVAQALGITRSANGIYMLDNNSSLHLSLGEPYEAELVQGPRVGISKAVGTPWRWRAG